MSTHANAHGWASDFAFVPDRGAPHKGDRNRAPLLLPGAVPRDRGDPPPSAASQWSFAPAN